MKEIRLLAVKITMSDGQVSIQSDIHNRQMLHDFINLWGKKSNGYFQVRISPPFKPRSTGRYSANHHYYGHVRDIQWQSGAQSMSQVHLYIKQYAIENMGFPEVELMGKMVPKSESDCNVEEESILIEACHIVAAQFGYELKENE